MDQTVVAFVEAQRPWRVSRRGPRRFSRVAFISLWLHLTLLALLLVTVRYNHQEEISPPPSTVSMVFEGGSPNAQALPNSRPGPIMAAPDAPPAPQPPAPQAAATPPPAPPMPQTALVPPSPPPLPQPPSPQIQAQPTPSPTPPPPAPPPPTTTAELPLPPPPPPLAMVVPRPALPPSHPVQPPSATPRPTPPNRSQAFPTPMNFSFNPASPAQRAPAPPSGSHRAPSTLDFSIAPRQGATDMSPFAMVTGATVGPDWRNALSAWVKAHSYYPEQAAMNGEDGSVMVLVQANPDGHVTSVELERKSGSQWLDMGLVALFRDAHLPPIFGEKEPIGFHFTMHYILIRQ